jgi:uncharacterized phage-associated protein
MAGGIEFDNGKFKELVLLLAERSKEDRRMSRVKLNKLLYRADFEAFRILGHSITGATYVKGEHGPMAKELPGAEHELERRGYLKWRIEQAGPHEQKIPVANEPADADQFPPDELLIIDAALSELAAYGGKGAREWSHKESVGWNEVKDDQEIPYHSAMFSMDPIPDEDIDLARALAIKRNWSEVEP